MKTFPKKATFRDWQGAFGTIGAGERLAIDRGFVCIYGPSEFLVNHSVEILRRRVTEKKGFASLALEAPTLDANRLQGLLGQGSLFEPATCYVVRRLEQAKGFGAVLKQAHDAQSTDNLIVLVHKGESPLPTIKTELEKLGAVIVPCVDPWPNEVPPLVRPMAKTHGVMLTGAAVDFLIETTGGDLGKLDNELTKLGLIFHAAHEPARDLDLADVAPHVGMLREDDAFQLSRLILAKQVAKAQVLAAALLDRGESALALIGIIASHCRSSIRFLEFSRTGMPPAEVASAMHLPPFVVKTYAQHLRGDTPARFVRGLLRCQEADVFLKTSRMGEGTTLAYVLDAFG